MMGNISWPKRLSPCRQEVRYIMFANLALTIHKVSHLPTFSKEAVALDYQFYQLL
ncbi:hypothetical protein ES708_28490 [subsurface metagenome]